MLCRASQRDFHCSSASFVVELNHKRPMSIIKTSEVPYIVCFAAHREFKLRKSTRDLTNALGYDKTVNVGV